MILSLPDFIGRFHPVLVHLPIGILLLALYHPLFILLGVILFILLVLILNYTSKKGISTSIEESNYKYEVVGFFNEMARTLKSFKFSQGSNLNFEKTNAHTRGYLQARTQLCIQRAKWFVQQQHTRLKYQRTG